MMRRSVLLPLPFGPTSTTFWPRSMCMLTSTSTTLSFVGVAHVLHHEDIALRSAGGLEAEVDLRFLRRRSMRSILAMAFSRGCVRRRLWLLCADRLDEALLRASTRVLREGRLVLLFEPGRLLFL